jgi:hypothetical protein
MDDLGKGKESRSCLVGAALRADIGNKVDDYHWG